MLILISDAKGPQLDWLVAKALGAYDLQLVPTYETNTAWQYSVKDEEEPGRVDKVYLSETPYSTDFAIGGPVFSEAQIASEYDCAEGGCWWAYHMGTDTHTSGPTELVAKARCYVVSKLGEEVEVPDEL